MDERVRSIPPVATAAARAARRTIEQIARSAIPALADFVVVFVVEGRSIVGVASAHATREGDKLLRALRRAYRVNRANLQSTVAQVVRTGQPSLRRTIIHEQDARPPRGSIADLHRRLACRSALVLPIRVGETVTGAVTLCYAGSGRSYVPADLAGAQGASRGRSSVRYPRRCHMPHPDYVPQLATLVATPPFGDEWLHEIKYDGYRIGARVRKGRVTLYTRNGNDWTAAFPELADAIRKPDLDDALIDGEAAMVLPDGRTSFQALQNMGAAARSAAIVYFVFDLLRLDGRSLEALPLEQRKARLKKLVGARKTGRIRYSEHITGNGDTFFAEACRTGLEGIVSKQRHEPYRAGRHGGWGKTKCGQRQEFVIG